MFTCPACNKPNNMYASVCQHCGGALTPAGSPPADTTAPRAPCIKCGNVRFVVVSPFHLPDTQNNGTSVALPVASGLAIAQRWEVLTGGSFRAHVCHSCGHTEWYAQDLRALVALVGKIPNVVVVEAKPGDPYR